MATLTGEQFLQKKAWLLDKVEAKVEMMHENGDEAGIKAFCDAVSAAIAEQKKIGCDDAKVEVLVKNLIMSILGDTAASSESNNIYLEH